MSLWRRDPRRFTTAESFQLFMEGVRALQLHEDEAAKRPSDPSAVDEYPSRYTLEKTLDASLKNLNDGVAQYPKDLLPRYYRGILLGLKAQESQALQLKAYLADPAKLPPECKEAEELLARAAEDFDRVAKRARGEIGLYAQYNRAQTLSRLNNEKDWEEALRTLAYMNLKVTDLSWLPRWKRILSRAILPFLTQEMILGNFAGRLFRQVGGEQGVVASAAKAKAERTALGMQVVMLQYLIFMRYAAQTSQPNRRTTGRLDKQVVNVQGEMAIGRLAEFVQSLRKCAIPHEAMDDMEAEYWNKAAYLLWEEAKHETDTRLGGRLLQQAKSCVDKALKLTGHQGWTPAQLNLARIFLAQESIDEARKVLNEILGVEETKPSTPPAPPQEKPDLDAIAELIIKMAPANNGTAIAQSIQRAWGPLDQPALQKLLSGLAGRIEPVLLSQILTQL